MIADVKHADYPNADLLQIIVFEYRRYNCSTGNYPPASQRQNFCFAKGQSFGASDSYSKTIIFHAGQKFSCLLVFYL